MTVRAGLANILPLTPLQEGLLFHGQYQNGESGPYLNQVVLDLDGDVGGDWTTEATPLDPLRDAVAELLRRHPQLRAGFRHTSAGRGVQVVPHEGEPPWSGHDLTGEPDPGAVADRMAAAERARGFDLARPPLLRFVGLRLSATRCRLVITKHHILWDGWSLQIVLRELLVLAAGRSLPEPPRYVDYVRWLAGRDQAAAERAWSHALHGLAEPTLLATAGSDPPAGEPTVVRRTLSLADTRRLTDAARRMGVTPSTVVQLAWAVVLGALTGRDDVVFGCTVSGRPAELPGVADMVGLLINTVPVRVRLGRTDEVAQAATRLQDEQAELMDHQHLGLSEVQRIGGLGPLFDSLVVYENYPHDPAGTDNNDPAPAGRELRIADYHFDESTHYPLVLVAMPSAVTTNLHGQRTTADERLELRVKYRPEALPPTFPAATVADRVVAVLEQIVGEPSGSVAALDLLLGDERRVIVEDWNDTATEVPYRSLVELFEERAASDPQAPALVDDTGEWSYRTLNAAANRLARRLRAAGVGLESTVGVYLPRSPELVLAMLAVLKAGGAFVPIDRAWPARRVAQVCAALSAVITDDPTVCSGIPVVPVTESESDGPLETDGTNLGVAPPEDGLAYVIFTSGSTGVPKGATIRHGAIAARLAWQVGRLGFGASDAALFKAPVSFDISINEIFLPLVCGARLVVAEPGAERDPVRLVDLIVRHRVTFVYVTSSMLDVWVELPEFGRAAEVLRHVWCGGEVLTPQLYARFRSACAAVMYHGYGPAEATIGVSSEVYAGAAAAVTIGRPNPNTRVLLLDARCHPVPVGVPGELYLGGTPLARGYLNDPRRTAERFVADPFGAPGERLYRTGDLGRYRPDGRIEFLGRADNQVKIRGMRVELEEIEATLARHPAVRQAVVALRDGVLLAWCVPNGTDPSRDIAPTSDELRSWGAELLPDHMVPSALLVLAALPLTASGKVDRTALPAPESSGTSTVVVPRPGMEEVVAGVFADVLGRPRVGATDDFFALGGHSLLAGKTAARLRAVLGREVGVRDLFEAPTVAGLVARVAGGAEARPRLSARARPDRVPLSPAQRRLWFVQQLESGRSTYHVPFALELTGAVDAAALRTALADVIARHESLRTIFPEHDGEPHQLVLPPEQTSLALAEREITDAELTEALATAVARPFELTTETPVRAALYRLAPERHVLLLVLHHIVADQGSVRPLLTDLGVAYTARLDGRPPRWTALPVQYADYTLWQREVLGLDTADDQNSMLGTELAHWRQTLAGLPDLLELPTDRPRPAAADGVGDIVPISIDAELHHAVRALAGECGASVFMVLQAVLAALLNRIGAGEDVPLGSPIAGRPDPALEDAIGFFLNTVVLRTDVSGDPSLRELLRRVRATDLAAYSHAELPFERLVEELNPPRSLGRHPLFQVMLAHQVSAHRPLDVPGLTSRTLFLPIRTAKFDLTVTLVEYPDRDGIEGGINYRTDLFDPETVAALAERFVRLLTAAVAAPDGPLGQLEVLTEAERAMHAPPALTGATVPSVTLPALVRRAAAPDAIAVTDGERHLTHRELQDRSDRLAAVLRARGIDEEDLVALLLPRSAELVVAMLATLKAGAGYLPLDVTHPADRHRFVVADARPVLLITSGDVPFETPATGGPAVLDLQAPAVRRELDAVPAEPIDHGHPDGLAYVIYTSGTTGTPKGVAIPQRNVTRLLDRTQDWFRFDRSDTWTLFHSSAFDFSVWEIWGALATGGRLVVVPVEVARAPDEFLQLLVDERVTVLNQTPSAYYQLAEARERSASESVPQPTPRLVIFGGEALDPARLPGSAPDGPRLVNMYGITETTVHVTYRPVGTERTSVVGVPIPDLGVYLLDERLRPVPPGVTGEMYVSGAGLARGYLGRAALTAHRFVADPFGPAGTRMYRSGDLARHRRDGSLEYRGRADEQVKIRGFRVEPGEIEVTLVNHDDVVAAAVTLREFTGGDHRLVAHLVAVPGRNLDPAALRTHLAATLPAHMVPAALVVVPSLPLTANGKLDRSALVRLPIESTQTRDEHAQPSQPASELERALCQLFAEQLGVPRVGAHDGFFELGGHSLLAVRLVSSVRATLGVELSVRDVFERQTPSALASGLSSATVARPRLWALDRPARVPLSPAQRRLWTLDQLQHGSPAYHVPLTLRLVGELDRDALGAAVRDLSVRHEVLRTVLPTESGEPYQQVLDLDRLPEPLRVESVEAGTELAAAAKAARRPFDLATDPPLRVTLYPVGAGGQEHLLLLCLHHVAADDWSIPALLEDLRVGYVARLAGVEADRRPLPVQYADYALWQTELLGAATEPDSVQSTQLRYWTQTLAGAPDQVRLPTDRPRPVVPSHRGGRVYAQWDAELHRAVRELAARTGTTVFMVVQAALTALLTRLGAGEDVVLGAPTSGRGDPLLDELVGFFVNTLALRTDTSGNPSFDELLARVRETDLGAFGHADVPFERVVEAVNPRRSAGRHPLFGVMLSYREAQEGELTLPGLSVALEHTVTDTAKFDLTVLLAARQDAGIELLVKYARDLFDEDSVVVLAERLERLLRAALADPSTRLAALPLLADDEYERIVREWNDTEAEVDATDLVTLLDAAVARNPSATALVSDDTDLTYRELDEQATRLARRLRAAGVRSESLVGVCLQRSPDLVIAMIAVLRAGGAFVPLDPGWPALRIAGIAGDLTMVLIHPATADRLPPEVLSLDVTEPDASVDLGHDLAQEVALPDRIHGDQLAYVIYTSGSTGVPKGAMIRHRAIAARLPWQVGLLGFGSDDAALFKAPVSFDISINEIFLPLVSGARLVIATPGAERDPARLVDLMARHRVSFVYLTSSMLDVLLELPDFDRAARVLRHVWCGGEVLTPELFGRFRSRCGAVMYHGYGPAEATIGVSSEVYAGRVAAVSIGRPNPNTRVLVLDGGCQPAPVGVPGEMYVGGTPLARGYLGDPARTAERFVADPFNPGQRLYRTGDLGRYLADGRIEFLGRADHQVKIRGMRVELGEIEGVLSGHPDVRQAVITAPGGRLAGYVAVRRGAAAAGSLRSWLGERLPEHMVPTTIAVLDTLPLTPSGKIDRAALPEPVVARSDDRGRAPATDRERLLCTLFAELLGVAEVAADEGFFDLGGDSIMVIQLVNRARAAGLAVAAGDVLDGGTPERIAAAATEAVAVSHDEPGGPLPLTPIMHSFRERGGPLHGFTQSMLLRVRTGLGTDNLARALDAVLARHDTLRLRVTTDDSEGGWRLDIAPPSGPDGPQRVRRVDAVELGDTALAEAVRAAAAHASDQLDPATGAMVHATWFDRGEQDGRLLLVVHHLAVDGVSWRIVVPDLATAWQAVVDGTEPALDPVPTAFARWSRALVSDAASPSRHTELPWWTSVVGTADLAMADRPLEPTRDVLGTARSVRRMLEPERTAPLYGVVPAAFGVGINDILLAALALAVADWRARHLGVSSDEVLIDLEGHGRHESLLTDDPGSSDLGRTVGWFTTVHPVRLRLGTDEPTALWDEPVAAGNALAAVAETLRAVPDGGIGFGLLRHLDPIGAATLSGAAVPQLGFNYIGRFTATGAADWSDASAGGALLGALDPKTPFEHPLEVNAVTTDGPDGPRLAVSWTWPDALWAREQVEDLASTWFRALDLLAASATPDPEPEGGTYPPRRPA